MKKRKFNILKFIIFLLIIYLLYYIIVQVFSINVKNIIILNNNYYSDEQIINKAKVEDYPKYLLLNTYKMKKNILKLPLVEEVTIKRKYPFVLIIGVKEKKVLFKDNDKQTYMISDGKYLDLKDVNGVPTLINYVPQKVLKRFVSSFSKIDTNVISKISDIEYSPTSYDKERFLLYMLDDNNVYININKMKSLNKYVSIVQKLENKKGILYLDSGNYFEIKK